MRYLTVAFLSVGAAALLSLGAVASAKAPQQQHVMTVELPFGGIETIHYAGNTPPTVAWSNATPADFGAPFLSLGAFDRMEAAMHREMAAFDRQMAALQRQAANAPEGAFNASTGAPNGFCAESVQMTQTGNQAPHVVRHSYGACGGSDAGQTPRALSQGAGQRT
jgi:hypothetical protein